MQECELKKLPDLNYSMPDDCKRLGPNEKETENTGTNSKHTHSTFKG